MKAPVLLRQRLPLIEAQTFYQCIEGSSDAVLLTDLSGHIVYANSTWQDTFQYTDEEKLGRAPNVIKSTSNPSSVFEEMWTALEDPTKGYWRGEVYNSTNFETEIPLLLSVSMYRDESGEPNGYMATAIDISEKKNLEEQVYMQDRLASIGLLASGLAHEIGTPIGVIRGRAEYALMRTEKDPHTNASLHAIIAQVDRISKLVYSLLHLTRPPHMRDKQVVHILPIITELIDLLKKKLAQNNITLLVDIDPEATALVRPDCFLQILLNLLLNAVHAIETSISRGPTQKNHTIHIQTQSSDLFWRVIIKDTGCGMSKKDLDQLFQPFFTTREVGEGTGLGLAIAYRAVNAWGGKIDVKSEEGKGSVITLFLPKTSA